MINMVKEIILDFQEMDLPTGVPRRVVVLPVLGKATVCIGVRRSGKSTFMFQIMLTGYLKSLGHKAPKSTVSDYLA